jgi:hypothetical protein
MAFLKSNDRNRKWFGGDAPRGTRGRASFRIDRPEACPTMKSLALDSVGQASCLSGFCIGHDDNTFEYYSAGTQLLWLIET